jgi:carboxymethylenebutenolidase
MGETVTIRTPEGEFDAYLARPASANAKAPAIVVIQEIFGVNQVMRDLTDGYAAQGYLALCPDLFWRLEPGVQLTDHSEADWKRAFELYNAFDVDLGVDIASTIAHARQHPFGASKVGAVGFCLGGLLAFLAGARTDVDASVSYYGVGIERHLGYAERITSPMLLHIAGEDQFVPKEAQALIVASLKNHPQVAIHTYPGRDHAFARKGGEHYDAADAERAGRRTLDFFAKALR